MSDLPAFPWSPADPGLSCSILVLVAACGACVGSFLNVVAWRLPREESLVHPPSHCPSCGSRLHWWQNLPVLGWLLIRGRCTFCHSPVSWRYPLVELCCALLWLAALTARPSGLGAAPPASLVVPAGWLLVSWLLPMVLIDIDRLWLPEPLCRWGVLLGLAVTMLLGFSQGPDPGRALLFSHLLAAGLGLLGLEGLSALGEALLGRPALGLGDAKLAALLGAWLGPGSLLAALAIAVVAGALVGGVARLSGRLSPHQPFAFGPFLALGGVAAWMFGLPFWLRIAGLSALG
jgi:leader peptidase (prepilin peptidase)/N-methyltransferase